MASRIVANCYYEFTIPTSVAGCHVYKHIWEATIGENILCQSELNNRHNLFAVAVSGYRVVMDVIASGRNTTGK